MEIQKQQETNWCWAAVAASIHQFLGSGGPLTQGQIATLVLQPHIQPGVDCSQTPELCNYPAKLDDALRETGDLYQAWPNHHLSFDNIKEWVKAQLPIGARILWQGGGAHFVVVDGYREWQSGAKEVHVLDPDPDSAPSYQPYEDFVWDYPPGGKWQDTYLVNK